MKKTLIIAALLCCVSFFANAQMQTLVVYNYSTSDVYLQLWGDVAGSTCSAAYSSGYLVLPPGTHSLAAAAIPGLSGTDEISLIEVTSDAVGGAPGSGCSPYTSFLMSPCASFGSAVTTHGPFTFYDVSTACTPSTVSSFNLIIPGPAMGELYIY